MAERDTPEGQTRRADLAAMVVPLGQALVADELPVLREHGLTMWAYTVLSALRHEPVRTQTALAQTIGADKTRIIGTLDELQQRGLIRREPDPADRRARLLHLTDEGGQLHDTIQRHIQRGEERWLGRLPAEERRAFLSALATLSAEARARRTSGT